MAEEAASIHDRVIVMETAARLCRETIADHEERIRAFEELTPLIKLSLRALSFLVASVVALIWSIITGQAQIIIR